MKPRFQKTKPSTPWKVTFPTGRRFFKTEEQAKEAIVDFRKGNNASPLNKRTLDQVHYCRQLLGSTPLLTAVRFYLEHHQSVTGTSTITDACDLYWSKVATKTASPYYTGKVRQHIANLKKHFGEGFLLTALGPEKYQEFMLTHTLSQQHSHHRTGRGLFKLAVARNLMAKNPTVGWSPPKIPKKAPEFLSVESVALILDWMALNTPAVVPAFALQLFCGVRTAELARKETAHKRPLKWKDVLQLPNAIDIPAEVSKTGERRVIDWLPENLWSWLQPYIGASEDRVACGDYENRKSKALRACKAELALDGIEHGFTQNAFRHSFATYGVAYFQSAERIALLMGHRGSDMLFRHYRNYTSQETAKAFFAVRPSAGLLLRLLAYNWAVSPQETIKAA